MKFPFDSVKQIDDHIGVSMARACGLRMQGKFEEARQHDLYVHLCKKDRVELVARVVRESAKLRGFQGNAERAKRQMAAAGARIVNRKVLMRCTGRIWTANMHYQHACIEAWHGREVSRLHTASGLLGLPVSVPIKK